MKAALLACLLALPCFAQAPTPATDAPTVVRLLAGQPAPADGVWQSDGEVLATTNAVQDGQSRVSLKVVLVAAGLCLAGGIALGIAIGRATR